MRAGRVALRRPRRGRRAVEVQSSAMARTGSFARAGDDQRGMVAGHRIPAVRRRRAPRSRPAPSHGRRLMDIHHPVPRHRPHRERAPGPRRDRLRPAVPPHRPHQRGLLGDHHARRLLRDVAQHDVRPRLLRRPDPHRAAGGRPQRRHVPRHLPAGEAPQRRRAGDDHHLLRAVDLPAPRPAVRLRLPGAVLRRPATRHDLVARRRRDVVPPARRRERRRALPAALPVHPAIQATASRSGPSPATRTWRR